ncbi:MAG: DUF2835 domain-containing protein [Gammaproteobacteria bacterium]
MQEKTTVFELRISAEQYKGYYQGVAKFIVVKGDDGKTIKFPASNLQRFLSHNGIHGVFAMSYDENNKLIDIRKIKD